MSRKRNPYIPLFTHDIMSSAKCRRLSMRATGLYLWLLCLMNEKPQQGRWALSTNEDHPTWKNSLTYRAMQNTNKYARLPMFATLMARQFLPWRSGQVLKALQELVRFKLIVVEDDAIIQPRMYNDNGFKLREDTMREYLADDPNDPNDDPEQDLADSYRETLKKSSKKGENKGADKGTKKGPRKVHGIHAPAPHAESESENNNNDNNSKGNKGVQGGVTPVKSKTQEKSPITENGASEREKKSGTGNLSSDAQKRADSPEKPQLSEIRAMPASTIMSERGFDQRSNSSDGQKIPVADCPPTLREIQDYMQQRGEGGDPFRHITAEQFYDEGCMSGWTIRGGQPLYDWRARLRSLEGYRRKNGEPTVTQEGYVAYSDGKLIGTLAVRQQPQGGQQGRVQAQPKPGDPIGATPTAKGKYKNKW